MAGDDQMTVLPLSTTGDGKFKILTLVVILSLIVTILALILSSVAISNKDDSSAVKCDCSSTYQETRIVSYPAASVQNTGEKIWMFQIGHFQAVSQYLHEPSGTIRGFNVDIVNGVCQLANKNCQLLYDVDDRCWDSEASQRSRGGVGLMANWYDTCVGWFHTFDRDRTMLFSNQYTKITATAVLTTAKDITIPMDFTGMTIGFIDGWFTDEHCLARFDGFKGFDQNDPDQVKHYPTGDDLLGALSAKEVDFAFHSNFSSIGTSDGINIVFEEPLDRCVISGLGLMMRKDQIELKNWWDAAFDRLKVTSEYERICERVFSVHGKEPGLFVFDLCPM